MLRPESLSVRLLVSGQGSGPGRTGEEVSDGTKEERRLRREEMVAINDMCISQTNGHIVQIHTHSFLVLSSKGSLVHIAGLSPMVVLNEVKQ